MTEYRDPFSRDPNSPRPDPDAMRESWSNATWGWIAGIAVVVLLVLLVFGRTNQPTQTATAPQMNPPAGNLEPPGMRPAPGVPAPTPAPPATAPQR